MENIYLERSITLRNDPGVHYNCAQGVVMPFADTLGLSAEQAKKLTAHFGAGMKQGEMCGAISGGLMVLGMLGGGDTEYKQFIAAMKSAHENRIRCADLLKEEVHSPAEKKPHCDSMVYEAVEAISRIMNL